MRGMRAPPALVFAIAVLHSAAFADILFCAGEAIPQIKWCDLLGTTDLFNPMFQLELNGLPPAVPWSLVINKAFVRTRDVEDICSKAHMPKPIP